MAEEEAEVVSRMHRFRLWRAVPADVRWVRAMLEREGRALGTTAELASGGREVVLRWNTPDGATQRS